LVASRSCPLQPALCINGYASGSAMSVQEANIFLAEMLAKIGAPRLETQVLGTHSCKATVLSWMAKASANETHRRLLGYHTAPGEGMMLEYSRDAMAGPLRSLVAVVNCIKLGKFKPDETRSGRWVVGYSLEQDGVEEVRTDVVPDDFEDPELGLTDGSLGESNDSACSEAETKQACAGVSLRTIGPAAGTDLLLVHNKTGTFHRMGRENNLACGRSVSTCTLVSVDQVVIFPKCKVCFGNS
jgi:hypothetical protein